MSEFQWQAPPSLDPNGNIGALMLRGPDALAQGQIEAARARAAGVANSGAIVGNAIAGAGQTIAQLPNQLQRDKILQQESVMRGAQIKDVLDHQKSTATFEAALKNPDNFNADGTPNNAAITKELRSKDIPAWQQWQTITTNNEKNALDHAKTMLEIENSNQSLQDKQRAAVQAKTDYLGKLAYTGVQTLDEKPGDPLHARDTALASIARGAADGVIPEQQAKSLSMQLASAGPDQIRQTLASAVPADLKMRLDKEAAETEKDRALAAEARSKAITGPPPIPIEQQLLKAIAAGDDTAKGNILKTIAADANAKRDPVAQAQLEAIRNLSQQAARDRVDNENPQSAKNQQKFEQEYRTVLQRAMSTRSGGVGAEDAKVLQANHLMSLFEQTYNPKTGAYDIPRVQLNELALGLAKLTAGQGPAGEGMLKEFQQRTAKGDIAGALTYLTGQPLATNTDAITSFLKDSIERQGKTASQNRDAELGYLRGLVPTDLNDERRQALEKHSLAPLRQSRVAVGPNGQKKMFVSTDGGVTWQ